MEKAKSKGGRPSSFTQAKADKICNMLIGGKNIRAICKDDELPSCSTVYKWLADNKQFSEQYAYARELQADILFDEILEIADKTSLDTIIDEDGVERTNHEAIQRSRLRVDARKWMAGKLRPRKYGDSSKIALTGKDGGPIEFEAKNKSVREIAREAAFLLTQGNKDAK